MEDWVWLTRKERRPQGCLRDRPGLRLTGLEPEPRAGGNTGSLPLRGTARAQGGDNAGGLRQRGLKPEPRGGNAGDLRPRGPELRGGNVAARG